MKIEYILYGVLFLVFGVCAFMMLDAQSKGESCMQSLKEIPIGIEKVVYIEDTKQIEQLKSDNKMLINMLWDMVKNPTIITIIEEHHSSSSSSNVDIKDICNPCPSIGRCPDGKKLESDGEDECGCILNPRCVSNMVTK